MDKDSNQKLLQNADLMELFMIHYQLLTIQLDAQSQQLRQEKITTETLTSQSRQTVPHGIHLKVVSNTTSSQLLRILIQRWDLVMDLV
jgi:hypothetical protein